MALGGRDEGKERRVLNDRGLVRRWRRSWREDREEKV